MVQLKCVIIQKALMMAVVLELTGLHTETGRERRMACCAVMSAALWLSGSTADSRQGKITLPFFLKEGKRLASKQIFKNGS